MKMSLSRLSRKFLVEGAEDECTNTSKYIAGRRYARVCNGYTVGVYNTQYAERKSAPAGRPPSHRSAITDHMSPFNAKKGVMAATSTGARALLTLARSDSVLGCFQSSLGNSKPFSNARELSKKKRVVKLPPNLLQPRGL